MGHTPASHDPAAASARRGDPRHRAQRRAPKPLVFCRVAAAIARATTAAVPAAVVIRSHEGAPFRHSPILPIFVENEPRPTGHYRGPG